MCAYMYACVHICMCEFGELVSHCMGDDLCTVFVEKME
jgi:hypothetical protein